MAWYRNVNKSLPESIMMFPHISYKTLNVCSDSEKIFDTLWFVDRVGFSATML